VQSPLFRSDEWLDYLELSHNITAMPYCKVYARLAVDAIQSGDNAHAQQAVQLAEERALLAFKAHARLHRTTRHMIDLPNATTLAENDEDLDHNNVAAAADSSPVPVRQQCEAIGSAVATIASATTATTERLRPAEEAAPTRQAREETDMNDKSIKEM